MTKGIAKALEEGVERTLRPALADAGKAVEKAVRSMTPRRPNPVRIRASTVP